MYQIQTGKTRAGVGWGDDVWGVTLISQEENEMRQYLVC